VKSITYFVLSVFLGGWLLSHAPGSMAAVPTMPDVPMGDIVDDSDSFDEKFVKIASWAIRGVSALMIAGVLITFFVTLWNGLDKVRDDKKHKDFTMGDLVTQVVVGVLVLLFTIPIGVLLYKYGTTMGGGA
jgi:heme A synthase